MSWESRDYSQDRWRDREAPPWREYLPSRGAAWLIGLHLASFLLLLMLSHDNGAASVAMLALRGENPQPLAMLTHPLAPLGFFSLLFSVVFIGSFGSFIEAAFGPMRLMVLYINGNLLAGAVYFALARWRPDLAGTPLDAPVGALAAWGLLAFRRMPFEYRPVFGKLYPVRHILAVCGAILAGLELIRGGFGALAWIAAALAGMIGGLLPERLPRLAGRRARRARAVVRPSPVRGLSDDGMPVSLEPSAERADDDIDDILAKISREGLASLSEAERARLEAARRAKLQKS